MKDTPATDTLLCQTNGLYLISATLFATGNILYLDIVLNGNTVQMLYAVGTPSTASQSKTFPMML